MLGDSFDDPRTLAAFAAAQALLGRGSTMQRLAGAGSAYGGTLEQRKSVEIERQRRMVETALMQQRVQQLIDEQKRQTAIEGAYRGAIEMPAQQALAAGGGPTVQNAQAMQSMAPRLNQERLISGLMGADPVTAAKLLQPQPDEAVALAPGAALFSRKTGKELARNVQNEKLDPNKPFLIVDGQIIPNKAYQDYELSKAERSATRVSQSVNTGGTLMKEVASGLGKNIDATLSQAQAAIPSIQTAQTLKAAVDSGKLVAGPGASFRVFGLQVGQMLGIGGENAAEVLANTRTAIQSMAQAELNAAQQMKGQGQITEAEREIIRRAAAGDINQLTGPEVRLLAEAMEKTARFKLQAHKRNVDALGKMEGAAPLIPFYNIDEPPQYKAPSATPQFRVLGRE